jgi:hypothetical protein
MKALLHANLFLLLLAAVFDPADQVMHLKVPLFVSLWVALGFGFLFSREQSGTIDNSLLIYVLLFSLVLPLTSILSYFVRGGGVGSYDGFVYLKGFLFVTLAIVLVAKCLDAIRLLSIVLTLLSCAIITMIIVTYEFPELKDSLWLVGDISGAFALSERKYADLSYSYVYFHASPLLVLSVAYFTHRTIMSSSRARVFNLVFLLVNLVGMVCSGTRNNLIFGLLTPLLVLVWYSRKRQRLAFLILVLAGVAVASTYGSDIVQAMFDPMDVSNDIKLTHLHDYMRLFSDRTTLLFGQGLGSYFYSSGFGTATSITELTYFEFIRNFGLSLAMVYFGLLLYPLTKLRDAVFRDQHYLLLAYGCYLLICVSNPLLISSNGMLVLAIVLARVFPGVEPRPSRPARVMTLRPQSA